MRSHRPSILVVGSVATGLLLSGCVYPGPYGYYQAACVPAAQGAPNTPDAVTAQGAPAPDASGCAAVVAASPYGGYPAYMYGEYNDPYDPFYGDDAGYYFGPGYAGYGYGYGGYGYGGGYGRGRGHFGGHGWYGHGGRGGGFAHGGGGHRGGGPGGGGRGGGGSHIH